MIIMKSKYDNMHNNRIFYALICINNHVITGINCMLSHSLSSKVTPSLLSKLYFLAENHMCMQRDNQT